MSDDAPKPPRSILTLANPPKAVIPETLPAPAEEPALPERSPDEKPPRVHPRIIAAPKHRQFYYCDFWHDAQLPEMWKTRPILVLSYKNFLTGPCLVVPSSTDPQINNPWAHELSFSLDGRKSWIVCNHLYTVAPKVSKTEFNQILDLVKRWLPDPFPPET
jgi:mRNA interferase MazF